MSRNNKNKETQAIVTSAIVTSTNEEFIALPTANLQVLKQLTPVRGLFDQCSQRSFILRKTVDKLGLRQCNTTNLATDCVDSRGY